MNKFSKLVILAAAPAALLTSAAPAFAGTEAYIGEISLFGNNFCPRGTSEAAGQILSISSNTALFSLFGTTFGGNGTTTFALPDLRGRAPIGRGTGTGLSSIALGEAGGAEMVTLSVANMPMHSHTAELRGENAVVADKANPNNATLALAAANIYSKTNAPNPAVKLSDGSVFIQNSGGSQAFNNRSPYLGMLYCVATTGIYPSRP